MNTLIALLAIFGLAWTIKEADGPFGIIARWRNLMMRIPFLGPAFFKLLDCYGCLGFWCGLGIYLLTNECYKLNWAICWALTGTTVGLIINGVLTRLHRE